MIPMDRLRRDRITDMCTTKGMRCIASHLTYLHSD